MLHYLKTNIPLSWITGNRKRAIVIDMDLLRVLRDGMWGKPECETLGLTDKFSVSYLFQYLKHHSCGLFGGRGLCLFLKAVQFIFVRAYWAMKRASGVKPARTQCLVFMYNKLHILLLCSKQKKAKENKQNN